MRKSKDEFAKINKTKHMGKVLVVTAAVLAVCITGVMYAKKLQMEQKYITMEYPTQHTQHAEEELRAA